MQTQNYTVNPGTSINEAVERAILIARAVNRTLIVKMNGARFCVYPDTKVQDAIDTYLEVQNKMHETELALKQKVK